MTQMSLTQCDSMNWEESTPRTGPVSWDEAI